MYLCWVMWPSKAHAKPMHSFAVSKVDGHQTLVFSEQVVMTKDMHRRRGPERSLVYTVYARVIRTSCALLMSQVNFPVMSHAI